MVSQFKFTRQLFFAMLLLISSFGFKTGYASHFAAADMYVKYIGTGQADLRYAIVLDVYKACEWGNSDLYYPEYVTISSASLGVASYTVTMDTAGTGHRSDTLDQLCSQFAPINSCRVQNTIYPGFVRSRYTDTVVLQGQATDWVFQWTDGSRNAGITNLAQGGNHNILITVQLNNLLHYNNSSPRFTVDPIPYLCINQLASFFNGPVDPNGDSIRVENAWPRGCSFITATACGTGSWTPYNVTPSACGVNGEIPYNTPCGTTAPAYPYSITNPVASSTPYTVDPLSGITHFTPTNTGKFVIAFRCYEYDRQTGTMLGYITRDVQVSVLNCNSPAPTIDTVPINVVGGSLGQGNVILGCPGSNISFTMQAHSQSSTNSVNLGVDTSAAPGCQFTITGQGTGNPSANFSWTPTLNDVGDHIVVIQAVDSTCTSQQPIVFRSYLVVLIKVITGIDAGPDKFNYCGLNGKPIQLEVTAGISGLNYHWRDIGGGPAVGLDNPNIYNPKAIISNTTTYVVSTNQLPSSCKSSDSVTIHIDETNSIKITKPVSPVLCRPDYVQLDLQTTGPRPLQNLSCGTLNPQICNSPDSTQDIMPANGVQTSTGTDPSTPFYNSASTRHQYLLKAADLRTNGLHSGTLKSIAFRVQGNYTNVVYKNLKVSLKCTTQGSLGTTSFVTGTVPVFTATGDVTFNTVAGGYAIINFDTPYSWDTSQNVIVDICYANGTAATPMYTYYNSTPGYLGSIYASTSSGSACSASSTAYIYSSGKIPAMHFNYCPADSANFVYNWVGNYMSDTTAKDPIAYVGKTQTFYVYTYGYNGCKVGDTFTVFVPHHNFLAYPKDTAICYGQSVYVHVRNGASYKWYEGDSFSPATSLSCDNCQDPLATPSVTTKYYIVVNDTVNCPDTLSITIVVKPLPNVHILNHDTTIKYGQSLQLIGSGAYLYSWSPSGSLSDPNVVNPVATPTEPTLYTLWAIGSNQCSNSDSVRVNIDYRDHLLIPTAFTPNGDGRNDEFKIVNMTFQKLMEFRVFNRWGQEIFSTTDGRKGWDGSWKGVAQDMGTYNYIIRVGYPDGYVETYKGDVTLVR
ncbi:gliding motility-associated C-terminal domain-containing protein [Chitinophagaceae bacterium MMS25-I14]